MNGRYVLFCVANRGTIEVPNGSQNDGEQILVSQPNNTPNEYW